jgi:hypothetical protein
VEQSAGHRRAIDAAFDAETEIEIEPEAWDDEA